MTAQHQKDLQEIELNGFIAHRGFRITQNRVIDRYETNKISGHSWPVYKHIRRWSAEGASDELRSLIVARDNSSISDARAAVDLALKFPCNARTSTPTEFSISCASHLVPGQYVRADLSSAEEGIRPLFRVVSADAVRGFIGECLDRPAYLVDLQRAFAITSVHGINPMTLDAPLPHQTPGAQSKALRGASR